MYNIYKEVGHELIGDSLTITGAPDYDFAQISWNALTLQYELTVAASRTFAIMSGGDIRLGPGVNATPQFTGYVTPYADNIAYFGSQTLRWVEGHFGSKVEIGRNTAEVGRLYLGAGDANLRGYVDGSMRFFTGAGLIGSNFTTEERDAIPSAISGAAIYHTNNVEYQFYNGSSWRTHVDMDEYNNITGVNSLTVTTFVVTNTVTTGDNLIILNDDVTGSPSEDAGIEIERGTDVNAQMLWDETGDRWQVGTIGNLANVLVASDLTSHNNATAAHGVGNVAALALNSDLIVLPTNSDVSSLITSHNNQAAAHGVANVAALALNSDLIVLPTNSDVSSLITTHNNSTAAHGVANLADFSVGLTDFISGQIDAPLDKPYIINLSSPYAANLSALSINTSTGTITANVIIDGKVVNGCSEVSVTSTNQRVISSNALNSTVAVNSVIKLDLSGTSSAENLAFSVFLIRS